MDSRSISKREHRTALIEAMNNNPEDERHGTETGYQYGCRCERCLRAHKKHSAAFYEKHRKMLEANPDDPRHGTMTAYRYGCRCEKCIDANTRYYAEMPQYAKDQKQIKKKQHQAIVKKELEANPDDPRHGTLHAYQCGCRCPECKKANSEYTRAYRKAHKVKNCMKTLND